MTPKRLLLFTLISASMLIFVMSLLSYLGNRLLIERSPLIEASEKIKLEATTAHLWFEEIMGGDSTESIEAVFEHIDSADWYANAMLEGGENADGEYYPLVDHSMRQQMVSVRHELASFRAIAVKRYDNFAESVPGTDIDSQFDKVFRDFIKHATLVESLVKAQIREEFKQYQTISSSLIVVSALLSLYLSSFLYQREKLRESLMGSLKKATASIEQKNLELNKLAHYDALTGLPNRVLFLDRLDQAMIHAMRTQSSVAILFLDLDHFKEVNDQYGHQQGDNLLKQVSQRMISCTRAEDTVVRISGDEFVVILSGLEDVTAAIDVANRVAGELIHTLQVPFELDGPEVYITGSIGGAIYPDDSSNGEELTRFADSAMYHAKSLGKNNFQFYSEVLNQQSLRRMETIRELRLAIEEDQLELYFQPQWQLKTGCISGMEVLVRWQHPARGLVFPDEFIGVAETCGLIQKLDLLIMEKAFKQNKEWRGQGLNFGTMSINVSPVCFFRPDFVANVARLIHKFDIQAGIIELEILESVLVENDENAQHVLQELKRLGVKVAIDDFGTGYSSMAYLKDFEVDTLKIDRAFIADSTKGSKSKLILKNMIKLGLDLELNVIAEGIETIEQEEMLKSFNCNIGQGYLLAKPLPSKDFVELLQVKNTDNVISLKTLK